uniref:Uncharacterized protein n=1 Tax=Kalanchoe fedtschenkoi TaxID=63787 RepID=A0A7N0U049_KALFE
MILPQPDASSWKMNGGIWTGLPHMLSSESSTLVGSVDLRVIGELSGDGVSWRGEVEVKSKGGLGVAVEKALGERGGLDLEREAKGADAEFEKPSQGDKKNPSL